MKTQRLSVSADCQLRVVERWPLAGLEAEGGRLVRSGHREGLIWGAGQEGELPKHEGLRMLRDAVAGTGTSSRERLMQRGVLLRQLFVEQ